jgi:hypothetical protein
MANNSSFLQSNEARQNKSSNLIKKVTNGDALDFDDSRLPINSTNQSGVSRLNAATGGFSDGNPRRDTTGFADGNSPSRLNNSKTTIASNPTAPVNEEVLTGELDGLETAGTFAGKDNASVSAKKNLPITSGEGITIESSLTDLTVPENQLLDYINLQYHLVLSIVPEPKVAAIQKRIPAGANDRNVGSFNELQRSIEKEGSVPIASTGDVFQSNLSQFEIVDQFGTIQAVSALFGDKNYYNIQSITFESTTAPRASNQFINSMLTGRIVLVEPHGFRLKEDLTRVGNKVGYAGLNPGRILYRLDIFFSGYNQDTGEWHSFIELDTRVRKTNILTYYINFTTVEAKIDHTGTTYDISYAPSGHVAFRPEEIVINSGAIITGSLASAETFGGFLERLAQSMETAVAERTVGQVKRKYEFKAPPQLLNAPFYTGNYAFKKGFLANDPKKGSVVTPARDVNVISLVEEVLQDMEYVWNEFLKKEDKKHLKPRIHWGLRFNTIFDSAPNAGTGDYDLITVQYIIEPFVTYKSATINNRVDMAEIMAVDAQTRRVEEMLKFGMVNRVYNYLNTSENTEVIELDVSLKAFFYHTMYKPKDSPASSGSQTSESASTTSSKRTINNQEAKTTGTASIEQRGELSRNNETTVDSALRRLFGREIDSPSAICDDDLFTSLFDVYGGGFGEMPTADPRSMNGSAAIPERIEYQANLNDHTKNDLLVITMDVKGDPIWLLNPYGVDSGNILKTQDQTNTIEGATALVQPQSSRCFFLRMLTPNQNDFMDPDRADASSSCSIIGGFYEVFKVTSKFESGKFVQVIEATKINNLNYIENFIGIISNPSVDTSPPSSGSNVPRRNQRPSVTALNSVATST